MKFPRVTLLVVGALLGALLLSLVGGCRPRARHAPDPAPAGTTTQDGLAVPQLETQDLEIGAGKTALTGAIVSIHYTGWFNRAKFDTSLSRDPLEFRLGKGEVLRGWDQGIPGMKVGGKRRLTLPPDFAYGAKGSPGGAIPPNSVLVFEIQLVDVKN